MEETMLSKDYFNGKGQEDDENNNNTNNKKSSSSSSSSTPFEMDLEDSTTESNNNNNNNNNINFWQPTGNWFKDFLFFCGPGWFVSIAYVDPGNYQADIQAGATSHYTLLFAIWWTSILSMYVQILCVRLAYHGKLNLAQAQARDASSRNMRLLNWFIAEFSIIITDLPEVIGIGIALHFFFGWPYYVGVLLSLLSTMIFLATMNYGMKVLEFIIFLFVGIMSIALFAEMSFIGPDTNQIMRGWVIGFVDVEGRDVFSIAGIIGAVVMPHNLYLHSAAVITQSQQINRSDASTVHLAVKYSSIEPILPIIVSFFVNLAIVAIAAETIHADHVNDAVKEQLEHPERVGLTDFCSFFESVRGGCLLWAIALLAAGQSSAITTTYTGQYVMDGFLNLQFPIQYRSIITRLVAITPCVIVSILLPNKLNEMINIVNASLSFLLPFAFTPLVKYNCSPMVMGEDNCSKGIEKIILYTFAILVWAINAFALSFSRGGFFGNVIVQGTFNKVILVLLEVIIQLFYAGWNFSCLFTPVKRSLWENNNNNNEIMIPVPQIS